MCICILPVSDHSPGLALSTGEPHVPGHLPTICPDADFPLIHTTSLWRTGLPASADCVNLDVHKLQQVVKSCHCAI